MATAMMHDLLLFLVYLLSENRLPLLRGTAASVERSGLAQGLAGTYSRGDIGTVEKHLAELERAGPDALRLYCELALRSIPLGLERGGYDGKHAEAMRALLRRALRQLEG